VSKARPVIEPVAPEIREEEIQPVVVAAVAPPVVEIAVPRKTFSVRERLSLFTLRMKALLPEIQPRVDKVAGDKIITPTIEWQQPEDDIPSVAEVLKVRATEQIEEIPRVVPEEIAVMPVSIEPPMTEEEIPLIQVEPEEIKAVEKADTKHHWRRSPASARKTRLPSLRRRGPAWFSPTPTEQITPISVEPAKVEDEIPVIQVAPEAIPAKIEDEKPNTTIPIGHMRLEDVTAKPIRIRSEQTYARIPWVKDVLKSTEPNRIPRDELEEITLVRARKPITIDLDRPTTPYGARRDKMFSFDTPDAVRFVPTLLGNSEKRRTIDLDPKDAIFSAYDGQPQVPHRIRRRLIAAGSLSVALLIGFLFADDLGRLLEAASSGDTVATTASPTQQSLSPVATLSSAKKKDLKNPNKIEESKLVVTKDRAVRADEKSPTSAARKSVTDDVKTKPVVKPAKNAPDKTPPSTGNKPAPGTRPRVVDEP